MATYTTGTHETVRQFVVTDRADLMQKVAALRADIGVLRSDPKDRNQSCRQQASARANRRCRLAVRSPQVVLGQFTIPYSQSVPAVIPV